MKVGQRAEPLIRMGYPNFWPVMLQRYERFFEYADDLGPTIDQIFSQGARRAAAQSLPTSREDGCELV